MEKRVCNQCNKIPKLGSFNRQYKVCSCGQTKIKLLKQKRLW